MTSPLITARPGTPLTAREVQILRCAANGQTTAETAAHLGLSYFTVKTHLSRIYIKLGARDRAHAVGLTIRSRQLRPAEIEPTDAIRDMT
ncbi:helix-turn-helix transcriptional regulator [Kitasatospora sp. MBT63]|uniref:helix-turn-helix domain-containing protein n=1 Tax=Kitasatospora sp. MBT63 TaxID=1444768 RepID=UPI0007C78126|nr:helix-turn-helix transcriptional regulator [Kitasatospora sp. MBT63]